jgi:hypothetical protein
MVRRKTGDFFGIPNAKTVDFWVVIGGVDDRSDHLAAGGSPRARRERTRLNGRGGVAGGKYGRAEIGGEAGYFHYLACRRGFLVLKLVRDIGGFAQRALSRERLVNV